MGHCYIGFFSSKGLQNGLRVLLDDKVRQEISDAIVEGVVEEVYIEAPMRQQQSNEEDKQSDFKNLDGTIWCSKCK